LRVSWRQIETEDRSCHAAQGRSFKKVSSSYIHNSDLPSFRHLGIERFSSQSEYLGERKGTRRTLIDGLRSNHARRPYLRTRDNSHPFSTRAYRYPAMDCSYHGVNQSFTHQTSAGAIIVERNLIFFFDIVSSGHQKISIPQFWRTANIRIHHRRAKLLPETSGTPENAITHKRYPWNPIRLCELSQASLLRWTTWSGR
jgi:hypothetical protein